MAETEDYQKIPSPLNADTVGNKSYSEISLEIDTKIGDHAGASDPHTPYLLAGGTRILGGDWDIGAGRMIRAEKIQARSGLGLSLFEDGGAGVFIKDGGTVGIGTVVPGARLEINTGASGTKGLIIKKVSGQTASLFETQQDDGDPSFKIDQNGKVTARVFTDSQAAWSLAGATGASIFTLDSTNVRLGVGTLSPTQIIEANAGGDGTALIRMVADNNINVFKIGFLSGVGAIVGSESANAFAFIESDVEKMRLSGGNLGIGKTTINYKLDVAGDINIDSANVYRVNSTQVVGARVVDARIDDEIEAAFIALYPLAAGLLDALRDGNIAHGLMAAT